MIVFAFIVVVFISVFGVDGERCVLGCVELRKAGARTAFAGIGCRDRVAAAAARRECRNGGCDAADFQLGKDGVHVLDSCGGWDAGCAPVGDAV
jgi:hypothetical protein